MKPGRNDPCPCGSGKKYKNCCLAAEKRRAETPQFLVWRRVHRAIADVPNLLAKFVVETYPPYAIDAAWEHFTSWDDSEFDPELPLARLFMPWFYHAWRPDEEECELDELLLNRSPTSVFLERHGRRLEPLAQRYLEACVASPYSFHEVLRCDPGFGFRTRDVLTGEEHEVIETLAAEATRVGDILFAHLVPIEGIMMVEACSPYPLGPSDKVPIIDLREKIAAAPPQDEDWPSPLHDWDFEIRGLYMELIRPYLDPERPVLHNTDGDPIVEQRVIFDVDDAERALEVLARVPGMSAAEVERDADERLERARLSWTKTGKHAGMEDTLLADVEIDSGRIVGHMNSDDRARAFCDMVEEALGPGARFRDRQIDDDGLDEEIGEELAAEIDALDDEELGAIIDEELDALEAKLHDQIFENGPDGPRLADDPGRRQELSRALEQYYDNWTTIELPTLGGKRPIDIMDEPNGREKVEALVAGIERTLEYVNPEAGPSVVARLRERLGLAPR